MLATGPETTTELLSEVAVTTKHQGRMDHMPKEQQDLITSFQWNTSSGLRATAILNTSI